MRDPGKERGEEGGKAYVHISKQTPTLVLSSTKSMIPAIFLNVEPMMLPAPAYRRKDERNKKGRERLGRV
jgi:hypothetical protein